jgi:hypothetical protein
MVDTIDLAATISNQPTKETAMPTLSEIETALSAGQIWAAMRNGRYWRIRRNGATKLWKTRPADYRIPIKAGLKSCGYIEQINSRSNWEGNFLISESDPNAKR